MTTVIPIRVLLFDEQRAFAEALAVRLDTIDDIRVVGIETRMNALPDTVAALRPDVVTLDISDGPGDPIRPIRIVTERSSATRVLALSSDDNLDVAVRAIWAGIAGWIQKESSTDVLVGAIRGAMSGDAVMPPQLLGGLFRRLVAAGLPEPIGDSRLRALTPRETEVLQCMVNGMSRPATADKLSLSPNTVRTHAQKILAKLGAHTSLEAVSVALAAGMRPGET
jgi:two-component system NarL family response regulator